MKTYKILNVIVFLLFAFNISIAKETGCISGKILYQGKREGPVVVNLYKLHTTEKGKVQNLQKLDIYGAKVPIKTIKLENPGQYIFDNLQQGKYSVFAFMDVNKNEKLDFVISEPLGWYSSEIGGRWDVVNLNKSNIKNIDCYLRSVTHLPKNDKKIEHGVLTHIKGLSLLKLWGTPEERGFAHGYLIAKQILDFFEFYIIEDSWRSPKRYQEIFAPFLENNLNCSTEFLKECDALIKGMKASGVNMRIAALNRDFNRTDLLAINSYIERRAAYPVEKSSSCTQFAFWGSLTENSDANGGLIAARNMDGECDIRKTTVSHFLLFAVDPAEKGKKRWFSAMWPGFIGTISGINEDGLFSMENAGGTGPGPVVKGITPCSWIQRYILENISGTLTHNSILKQLNSFKCNGGGVTVPGSIILWALPFQNKKIPAFVYEGDRFGGAMRFPADVRPKNEENIMAANHHLKYGFNEDEIGYSFGKPVSFSSRWRYETGKNTMEAWTREKKQLGTKEAIRLLQMVSHGTTEYSIIFLANQKTIMVAVDDLKADMWDAPYNPWIKFKFDDIF